MKQTIAIFKRGIATGDWSTSALLRALEAIMVKVVVSISTLFEPLMIHESEARHAPRIKSSPVSVLPFYRRVSRVRYERSEGR